MFEIVGFSFAKQTSDSIACRFKIGTVTSFLKQAVSLSHK